MGWQKKALKAPLPEELQTILDEFNTATGDVVSFLSSTVEFLDLVKDFFISTNDAFELIMNEIISQLENLNNDLFGSGVFQLAIHPFSIPKTEKRRDSEEANRPYDIQFITPNRAIKEAIKSFDDKGDENRPIFSDSANVSAVALLVTAKDLGLYLEIMKKFAAVWNVRDVEFAIESIEKRTVDQPVESTGADWDSFRLNQITVLGQVQEVINTTLGLCRGYQLVPRGLTNLIDALARKVEQLQESVEVFNVLINDISNISELANVYVLDVPLGTGGVNRLKAELPNPELQTPNFELYRYTFMLMYVGGGPSAEPVDNLRKLIV